MWYHDTEHSTGKPAISTGRRQIAVAAAVAAARVMFCWLTGERESYAYSNLRLAGRGGGFGSVVVVYNSRQLCGVLVNKAWWGHIPGEGAWRGARTARATRYVFALPAPSDS